MPADAAATLLKPRIAVTSAMTKKITAQFNISTSFVEADQALPGFPYAKR